MGKVKATDDLKILENLKKGIYTEEYVQKLKLKDTFSFKIKAYYIHKDRYNFEESNYISKESKVKVFCNKCKEYFNVRVDTVIRTNSKGGCPNRCWREPFRGYSIGNLHQKEKTLKEFKEYVKISGLDKFFKYDFSSYKSANEGIVTTCLLHNETFKKPLHKLRKGVEFRQCL